MSLYFFILLGAVNRYIYIFIINYLSVCTYAQIIENFNDSTWLNTTAWKGQVEDFKINSDSQLQSIGNTTGVSTLYTYSSLPSFSLSLWIKLGFAPSESNKLKIYLQADDTLLAKANAYYLEIGENGNNDAIKLYRQSAGKSTLISESKMRAVAGEPVIARLKIHKSILGFWSLSTDYTGGEQYEEEWTIKDDLLKFDPDQNIVAIQCLYTSTRRDKFYFDDLVLSQDSLDLQPPAILSIQSDSNTVTLFFDEPIDSIAAIDTENYVVSNGIGQPWRARLLSPTSLIIYFIKQLSNNTKYEIICKRITDRSENSIINLRGSWTHKIIERIQPFELLITELMVDPSPVVGLPDYEYIEILNNSNRTIDLAQLKLKFDQSIYVLDTTSLSLSSGAYVVLCETKAVESIKPFVSSGGTNPPLIFGLKQWPTLRNTSGLVGFADEMEKSIHFVSYVDQWYKDTQKDNGGWSLEMINPNQVCNQLSNWRASTNALGGTPGKANSVWDITRFESLRIDSSRALLDHQTIYIYTNQPLGLVSTNDLIIQPSISIQNIAHTNNRLEIKLAQSVNSGIVYQFVLKAKDCTGRPYNEVSTQITKVETISRNDLIINEILFNPVSGGSDYVELYNRSGKVLSLNNMVISNSMNQQERRILTSSLILPGTYWVLSADPQTVLKQYSTDYPNQLINQSLPSFPDDQGQVSIWSANRILIDSFTYHQSMHLDLLNSKEGVALERINENTPPVPSNWYSASGAERYGTPTRKNSASIQNKLTTAVSFSLNPKVFTPDHNGVDDALTIHYSMPDHGYLARIEVFTDRGQPIRRLANNLSLSLNGSLDWDGKDDRDQLMPAGIYVISILVVNNKGEKFNKRLTGILSR